KGNHVAPGRDAGEDYGKARFIEHVANRVFQPGAPLNSAHNSEIRSIRRPVSIADSLEDFARRTASERHPSQRSVGELDSQLSGGRNSQDVALGQSQRTRFRTFGTSRENLDGLSLPGGTVNDRLAIGRKPRRRD